MKYFTCVFGLLFLLLSNVVSAGLVSWPSQSFYPSRSHSTASNIKFSILSRRLNMLMVKSVQFTPDYVKPGDELTIDLSAYLMETIEKGATVEVDIYVGSNKSIRKEYDLCSVLSDNKDKIDLTCPIKAGEIVLTQKVGLRENIPKELIEIVVRAYTSKRELITDFIITADFSSSDLNEYLDFGN